MRASHLTPDHGQPNHEEEAYSEYLFEAKAAGATTIETFEDWRARQARIRAFFFEHNAKMGAPATSDAIPF